MNILIIEDEKLAAERLEQLVNKIEKESNILAKLDSIQKAVKWFASGNKADLVFMDIQLADGLCFEIFEKVEISFPVVFTTAYDEYAIKAFKVNSIDYLLKPINEEDLANAFQKFHKLNNNANPAFDNQQKILQLEKTIQSTYKKYKNRFVVKTGDHLNFVPVAEIDCFFSRDKASYLYRSDKRQMLVDYSLDQVEEMVDPQQFFRVSRKFIVQLESIKDVIAYSNSRLKIILKNGEPEEIVVSREKVGDFKDWLDG